MLTSVKGAITLISLFILLIEISFLFCRLLLSLSNTSYKQPASGYQLYSVGPKIEVQVGADLISVNWLLITGAVPDASSPPQWVATV